MARKTKSKSIEVSSKSRFGRRSEMDKVIEKWTSKGWELKNTTPTKNGKYLLQFEREPSRRAVSEKKEDKRNGCLGIILVMFICSVVYALTSNPRTQNFAVATRTSQAIGLALERETQTRQPIEKTSVKATPDANATLTTWTPTLLPSSTPTPTTTPIPTNTVASSNTTPDANAMLTTWTPTLLPSSTPTPTTTPIPTNTVVSSNTPSPTSTSRPTRTPLPTRTLTPVPTLYVISSNSQINARSCPSTDCEVVNTLSSGTTIFVVETTIGQSVNGNANWFEIILDGETAYVHSSLASPPTSPTPTAIVPTSVSTPTGSREFFNSQDIEDATDLSDAIFILAGGRNVESVVVTNGRPNGGERAAIVAYLTSETTDIGYVEEIIDLFGAIASGIQANGIDLDSISLVAGDAFGNASGIIVASVDDLIDFKNGRISRSEFLNRLSIVPF